MPGYEPVGRGFESPMPRHKKPWSIRSAVFCRMGSREPSRAGGSLTGPPETELAKVFGVSGMDIISSRASDISFIPPPRRGFFRADGLKNSHFYAILIKEKEINKPGIVGNKLVNLKE